MKILQVSKKFPIPSLDGETIAIIEMGKALIDEGCEVSLLTMNTTRHYKNFTLDQIKEGSVVAGLVKNIYKFI